MRRRPSAQYCTDSDLRFVGYWSRLFNLTRIARRESQRDDKCIQCKLCSCGLLQFPFHSIPATLV